MSSGPRYDEEFAVKTVDSSVRFRFIDRITVDDVVIHLVHREIHKILTGEDNGVDVERNFKDFLVKERLMGS